MTTKQTYDFEKDARCLRLLARSFPTIADASTEIINLEAILHLPKGTEHFLADVHGEHEAFSHILKNASGDIKRKVNDLFGNRLRESEKKELCTLIYYPKEKLEIVKAKEEDINDWYHVTLTELVSVCRDVSGKYTRSKVRKLLPNDFSYIIQELLHERTEDQNKTAYVNVIIDTIISTGRADDFIITLCELIQQFVIDQLHILGDIFDRGPGAHIILDTLMNYHNWDIQWGNHDIVWMGAAAGSDACVCSVIRLSLRYGNLTTLEDGYGINLMPLVTFAMDTYGDDPCTEFLPKMSAESSKMDERTLRISSLMHKAIAIMQFKMEAQLYHKYKKWNMEDRDVLSRIDYEKGTFEYQGQQIPMTSNNFPTVDPKNPTKMTVRELEVLAKLKRSFTQSDKLQRHVRAMLSHGCMYAIHNGNLLYHASCPLNEDGSLKEVELYDGHKYKGRELMHNTGMLVRAAFQSDTDPKLKAYATDYFMYLWCGKDSVLFDKSAMTTFERYFIKDKKIHHEEKGWYIKLRDNEKVIDNILDEFGVKGRYRHIINGHVPVHVSNGETPVKANGKLLVIDGGFSEAYHKETGIAGFTLVYHSRGFQLVQHEPFTSTQDAIEKGTDIKSTTLIVENTQQRMLVADTDIGDELRKQISDLEELLWAYRHGFIQEKSKR